MGRFVVWDYVVFAAMLLVSAVIGVYYAFAGGGQKTSKDFLMAGRSMSAIPVALSLTASFMSAVTVLGTPAEIYRYGAIFCIFAITYGLVVLCSAEIFLPVFYKLGITSTYEVRWKRRRLSVTFRELGDFSCLFFICLPSVSFPKAPCTLCCPISPHSQGQAATCSVPKSAHTASAERRCSVLLSWLRSCAPCQICFLTPNTHFKRLINPCAAWIVICG